MFEEITSTKPQRFLLLKRCDPHAGDLLYVQYARFLREVGYGPIGPGDLAIAPRLRSFPSDWRLKDDTLRGGLRLFGEDLAGSSFGFHSLYGQQVLRYSSEDGVVGIEAPSFLEFLRSFLDG